MSARKPLVAGNWKMFKRTDEARALVRDLIAGARGNADVLVAPPFTALAAVREVLGTSGILLGAQNVHWERDGAFTGEVSAAQLQDVGCTHVIIGHSERRHIFGETDANVQKKTAAVLAQGLIPIVCVGETLAERESGATDRVVLTQLDAALAGLTADQVKKTVVAYEPVWAIGTGKNAEPADAQAVHAVLRRRIAESFGADTAQAVRILYGGSVKPNNAKALLSQADIDGALVGGASLDAPSFLSIVAAAE